MKQCDTQQCIKCHFLSRTLDNYSGGDGQKRILNKKERQDAEIFGFSFLGKTCHLFCHFEVWDEVNQVDEVRDRKFEVLKRDRTNFCFFWPYSPEMSVKAAEILQKREADNREASIDRKRAVKGLWIAGIGLGVSSLLGVANLVISIIKLCKGTP